MSLLFFRVRPGDVLCNNMFSCAGQGKDIINEFYAGRYAVVFFQGKRNIQSDKRCRVYDSDRIYDVTALSFLYDRGLHFKRLTGGWKKYSRADTEKSILVAE